MLVNKVMTTPENGAPVLRAISSLVLSLIVCIVLIPDDFREPGALFWPALSLATGLLIVPALRIRFTDIRTALRAENFVLVAFVYWILLDLLQFSYPLTLVDVGDVKLAFASMAVMASGLWIGLAMPRWRVPKPLMDAATVELRSRQIFVAILICFAISTFYYVYKSDFSLDVLVTGFGLSRWESPWSRGQFGDWNAFIEHLTYFGFVLPSLTVLLARTSAPPGWVNTRVILSLCLSAVFVAFLAQSGSRRLVGIVIGAALLTWIGLQSRIKVKHTIITVSVIVGLLVALQNILYIRRVGLEAALEGKVSESDKLAYVHVDDNFLRLSQIIKLIPDQFDYVGHKQILYTFVRPIPRALWPDKPTDPGFSLPSMIGWRGAALFTSLSSSIIGELYATWGLLAVFFGGVLYGRLSCMWNGILYGTDTLNSRVIYGLGIMVLFSGIRSMQDLVIMTYGILGWMVMSIFLHKLQRRRVDPSRA
jgi:hypothetical protein